MNFKVFNKFRYLNCKTSHNLTVQFKKNLAYNYKIIINMMAILPILLLCAKSQLDCNETICPKTWIQDGKCD